MAKGTKAIDGTTEQQKLFAYAYYNNRGHGTNAAIEAGYSAKTATATASRLLTYVNIKAILVNLNDLAKERAVVTKEEIAKELAKTGFFDVRTVYKDGSLMKIDDLPDQAAASIIGIKVLDVFEGYGEDRTKIGETVEVKLNSKINALAELNKMYGYYAPVKTAATTKDGDDVQQPMSDDHVNKIISAIRDAKTT